MRFLNIYSLIVGATVLLAGCSVGGKSTPARFYGLHSKDTSEQVRGPATPVFVSIGSVSTPASLDRTQLLIKQNGTSAIDVAEFDRWIEGMSTAMPRVIAENIDNYAKNIHAKPMRVGYSKNIKYIVSVDVIKLETERDANITLEAWWTISNSDGDVVTEKKFVKSIQTPAQKSGHDDFVSIVDLQNQLIAELSHEIANNIIKMEK